MFCDQTDTYCGGGGGERLWGKEWNNLIRQQHVEQSRSEGSRGRKGTLNLERDYEIVCPRPAFLAEQRCREEDRERGK